MGDLFVEYFGKCMAGMADAAQRGREPSPTTQENCAVMMRELKNAVQNPPKPALTPAQRQKLMPPPKARPNILLKTGPRVILKKQPNEVLINSEKLLEKLIDESLSAEHGKQMLKNLRKQVNPNKLHLYQK